MAFFAEKTYNQSTNRLFLVYYALPDGIVNQNNWGVTKESLNENIHTFIGKPVVLKRKDLTNPLDVRQKGEFVHPMVQHGGGLKDLMTYQENYAVGRIADVKLNPTKGYRFDVEITDPKAKEVLSADKYIENYPPYVSPLIVTFPHQNPNQDETKLDHWLGAHLAFVDEPAYGFERMDVAGKCLGTEELCTIKLHNASESETSANFCIKDAMVQLLIGSSQVSQNNNANTETTMSATNTNVTTSGTDSNSVRTTSVPLQEKVIATTTDSILLNNNKDNSGKEPDSPKPQQQDNRPSEGDQKPQQESPITLEDAIGQINSLKETVKELTADKAKTNKFIADLTKKERISTLKTIIPRQLFKSEDKYNEELERVYNWKGMEDADIREHYQGKLLGLTVPVSQKSASTNNEDPYKNFREVPDFHKASQQDTEKNKVSSPNVLRDLKFMKRIAGGGN